ncbi:flagellar basal body P-ring formation chaperone FlgA [Colwellia sp. 4_MG-2023]|uniref:flagellar basal body P-ring formation chaperone FlgA n=1 Tax=unclassified Colwellia TaxID=196834 RepID=UPI001C08C825|nr:MULTISPECIES: flagellar basal body P-ring formation chaperone FlgA [unclassified Colwellia]MBU2923272.1 flagellar basal body P-ring formation protein FlgA [Colwellia sp. C2M11]MDO6489393.1 flagellar basal body P-ring formation chaperone FlgA [Colwellia sp. 6_MG-2023]MDO6506983.1 flagellar basal body P-ring formation chaperone FlgA [Colwellia sp. 5_MG-2023]MDO6557179.1 flagellar basal body P-ring formation chaperone FlgA [Colwellia sp. 4_MG-2023]MDO6654007.1 flagellar basal body P-ring forma
MRTSIVYLSFICLLMLLPSISLATTWDRAYIESFAKKYLEANIPAPADGRISFNVTNIDTRIIIKPCQVPIKANIPENTNRRNVNVNITCDDATPWQLYLPAKIERTFAVVVTTSTIEKGEVLTKENIAIDYIATNKIRGERITDINSVLGSKAEKRIGNERTITKSNICLVCKGDVITIIAKNDNFLIKTKGTALSSGNLHEQIEVKNSRSGRIIKPQISAVNQVTINL